MSEQVTQQSEETISITSLFSKVRVEIEKKGFEAESAKVAKATCRDDSIGEMISVATEFGFVNPKKGKYLMNLETAAAVPSYGEALVGAFYHHIPDKGIGVIILAPHYGIDSNGRIGYLDREGQLKPGKSCGANHGLLGLWKEDQFGPYEHNPELSELSSRLLTEKKRILESEEPIKLMAEIEHNLFLEEVVGYVKSVQLREEHKFPILIASGINVDTHRDQNNKFRLIGMNWVIDGKLESVYNGPRH